MSQSTAPHRLQACAMMLMNVTVPVACIASWSLQWHLLAWRMLHAQAGCRAMCATGSEQCHRQGKSGAAAVCTCAEEALPVLLAGGRGRPFAGGAAPPAAPAPPVGLHLLGTGLQQALSVAGRKTSGGQRTTSLSSRAVLARHSLRISHVHRALDQEHTLSRSRRPFCAASSRARFWKIAS